MHLQVFFFLDQFECWILVTWYPVHYLRCFLTHTPSQSIFSMAHGRITGTLLSALMFNRFLPYHHSVVGWLQCVAPGRAFTHFIVHCNLGISFSLSITMSTSKKRTSTSTIASILSPPATLHDIVASLLELPLPLKHLSPYTQHVWEPGCQWL